MANPPRLPNELLTSIVGRLRDRRIDPFDPVATKDLQSVRLVSKIMLKIATPMLFENMVYDLSFYRPQDVNSNPDLAQCVHRLQVKTPPVLDPISLFEEEEEEEEEDSEVHEVLLQVLQLWCCSQHSELKKSDRHTSAIREIAMQKLADIKHKLFTDKDISLEPHYDSLGFLEPDAFYTGFIIVLNNMTKTITSLKMRDVLWHMSPEVAMIPENLQHMDLEIHIWGQGNGGGRVPLIKIAAEQERIVAERTASWHRSLRRLRQPETQRLGLYYGSGRATAYEAGDLFPIHIDDLFVGPEEVNHHCFFPKLKSLEFFDCALRISGLLSIAEKHQKTLKELVLTRVALAPKNSSQYWCEIGDMCKDALPGLTYLRLAKLVTCCPKRFNHYDKLGVDMEPTPANWRSGLEDAMRYEWKKDDVSGTGQEFIGLKRPWTCDEDEKARKESVVTAGSE